MGLGYMAGGLVGMLEKLGHVQVSDKEVEDLVFCLRQLNENLAIKSNTQNNFAKELATKIKNFSLGIISAEFLRANAHIFANQTNETSKNFSFYYHIPSLNHHLLEGFGHPGNLYASVKFVIFDSDLYSPKISKRIELTKNILEKQKIEVLVVKLEGTDKLTQAFEGLLVSSWTTYYLGILYDVDPSKIPWVDYFKNELAK
jgi:hypothetical protein